MDLFSSIDVEPARQRMEQLADEIDRLNYEYYMNDRSLVSDQEFDAMLRELQDLERQYPELASPLSPTKRVGGEVNKTFRSVQHRFPMLSLGNTSSIEEIEDFEARTRKLLDGQVFSYSCELKYDGVAIGLTYRHGRLVQAVTRGNGSVGDDITSNAKTIATIPLRLRGEYPDDFEVRGEVVYPFEAFDEMNKRREAEGDEVRTAQAHVLPLLCDGSGRRVAACNPLGSPGMAQADGLQSAATYSGVQRYWRHKGIYRPLGYSALGAAVWHRWHSDKGEPDRAVGPTGTHR